LVHISKFHSGGLRYYVGCRALCLDRRMCDCVDKKTLLIFPRFDLIFSDEAGFTVVNWLNVKHQWFIKVNVTPKMQRS